MARIIVQITQKEFIKRALSKRKKTGEVCSSSLKPTQNIEMLLVSPKKKLKFCEKKLEGRKYQEAFSRTVLELECEQRATTKNMMYRLRFIKKSASSELKTWLLINVKHVPINHH